MNTVQFVSEALGVLGDKGFVAFQETPVGPIAAVFKRSLGWKRGDQPLFLTPVPDLIMVRGGAQS